MIRCIAFVTLFLAAFRTPGASAQTDSGIPGWRWRADKPAADTAAAFDQMAPGWHMTSKSAGLLYPAGERATGSFSHVADFVVFPETTDSGFGIFLGGADLEGSAGTYVAALLRRDGAFSVISRAGGSESVLVPWTRHSAVKAHPGTGTVTNRLRINASVDSLRIFVNDSSVARIKLGNARTNGHFGFRVGERVNLHLTILDLIRHLAPARSR